MISNRYKKRILENRRAAEIDQSDQSDGEAFQDYAEIAALLAFMMRLAGFPGDAQRFVETVIKTSGIRAGFTTIPDGKLADVAGVTTKTIQRWRKSLKDVSSGNFSFVRIIEGDYQGETQSYIANRYKIDSELAEILTAALQELYSIENYNRDRDTRLQNISRIAGRFYVKLPKAKIQKRKRPPVRRQKTLTEKVKKIRTEIQNLRSEKLDPNYFEEVPEVIAELGEIQNEIAAFSTVLQATKDSNSRVDILSTQVEKDECFQPDEEDLKNWQSIENRFKPKIQDSSDKFRDPLEITKIKCPRLEDKEAWTREAPTRAH